MSPRLTDQSNLEALRKEAKRWLKALRENDQEARDRLARIHPGHGAPMLRVVQHALALEYGFPNWAALKREIEKRAFAARSHAERVTLFLEKSSNRYGVAPGTQKWNTYGRDKPANGEMAARLLARHPEIARDSIHTAVAAHDLEAVLQFLSKDPSLANQPGGPDGWTPLLRLAYTRIAIDALSRNAIQIARALLNHGANPDVHWSDGANKFTAVTGVIGGGEGGQSPHPQAEALSRLLIEHGAEPFDFQALYNTSLGPDSTLWLELLWSESSKRGETNKWSNIPPDSSNALNALDYLLGNAVPEHPNRAEWLLRHGANARTVNAYSRQPVVKHALLAGNPQVVELLVRHGATRPQLSDEEVFVSAAMQGDMTALQQFAQRHPSFLQSPHAMFAAIRQNRADVARLLLDLGMSPNVSDLKGFSALHLTTHTGAIDIARLLIERGAAVDAIEHNYNSTPLGHANYQGRAEMVDLLAPLSRDIRGLCFAGAVDRLAQLLAADPALASTTTRGNEAPLFALPDDDERAAEVAELLLAHGADPAAKNGAGLTPSQAAKKRGLEETASLISAAEG